MIDMPLPPWNATEEQRQLLEEAAAIFRRVDGIREGADSLEAEGWAKVAEARRRGAPKDGIVEFLPRSRPTVYRHLPAKDQPGDGVPGVPSSS